MREIVFSKLRHRQQLNLPLISRILRENESYSSIRLKLGVIYTDTLTVLQRQNKDVVLSDSPFARAAGK